MSRKYIKYHFITDDKHVKLYEDETKELYDQIIKYIAGRQLPLLSRFGDLTIEEVGEE